MSVTGFMAMIVVMARVVVFIVVRRRFFVKFGVFGLVVVLVAGVVVMMMFLGVGIMQFFRQRLGMRLDDSTLNALAVTAPARIAMARTAAAGAIFGLFLRLAVGALVGFDERLAIGDRDLVIVGMDFAEGQEAVAVAAVFDEGRLQRRFDPCDLGQIDVAAQLFALRGLEIKFFDAIAADHDDPGLLRVGGIDKHLVGHFGTLDGGGRAGRRAQLARPGDATVHLIRG